MKTVHTHDLQSHLVMGHKPDAAGSASGAHEKQMSDLLGQQHSENSDSQEHYQSWGNPRSGGHLLSGPELKLNGRFDEGMFGENQLDQTTMTLHPQNQNRTDISFNNEGNAFFEGPQPQQMIAGQTYDLAGGGTARLANGTLTVTTETGRSITQTATGKGIEVHTVVSDTNKAVQDDMTLQASQAKADAKRSNTTGNTPEMSDPRRSDGNRNPLGNHNKQQGLTDKYNLTAGDTPAKPDAADQDKRNIIPDGMAPHAARLTADAKRSNTSGQMPETLNPNRADGNRNPLENHNKQQGGTDKYNLTAGDTPAKPDAADQDKRNIIPDGMAPHAARLTADAKRSNTSGQMPETLNPNRADGNRNQPASHNKQQGVTDKNNLTTGGSLAKPDAADRDKSITSQSNMTVLPGEEIRTTIGAEIAVLRTNTAENGALVARHIQHPAAEQVVPDAIKGTFLETHGIDETARLALLDLESHQAELEVLSEHIDSRLNKLGDKFAVIHQLASNHDQEFILVQNEFVRLERMFENVHVDIQTVKNCVTEVIDRVYSTINEDSAWTTFPDVPENDRKVTDVPEIF